MTLGAISAFKPMVGASRLETCKLGRSSGHGLL